MHGYVWKRSTCGNPQELRRFASIGVRTFNPILLMSDSIDVRPCLSDSIDFCPTLSCPTLSCPNVLISHSSKVVYSSSAENKHLLLVGRGEACEGGDLQQEIVRNRHLAWPGVLFWAFVWFSVFSLSWVFCFFVWFLI